jgi:hypothetical protein
MYIQKKYMCQATQMPAALSPQPTVPPGPKFADTCWIGKTHCIYFDIGLWTLAKIPDFMPAATSASCLCFMHSLRGA